MNRAIEAKSCLNSFCVSSATFMADITMKNLLREKSCAYSANSALLKCAVNPIGNCSECSDYEARQTNTNTVVIQATARTGKSVLMWEIIETALVDELGLTIVQM